MNALIRHALLLALAAACLGAAAPEEQGSADEVVPDEATPPDAFDLGDGTVAEPAPETATATPSARGRYNEGLAHFEAGEYGAAADAFLAARDDAGPDPQLRYRAAFNLGMALAVGAGFGRTDPSGGEADTETEVEPASPESGLPSEEVIDRLRQSAAWFSDAVRLAPPGDEDARINLELVSKWILQLADQLNQANRLEARLDRLIDDQRSIRDQVRGLLTEIAAQAAGAEPVGFAPEFEALASRERVLTGEVGDVVDLAAEERLFIEQTPEAQRPPEQQSRAYQLAAMTGYLERARQSLSDARLRLRRLEGERAHRRVDAALAELKRAREQLLDPVGVLAAVARDERELIAHTGARRAFAEGAIDLDAAPPGWLTDKHLAERQEDIAARTGGVLNRFEAVTASDPSTLDGVDAEAATRAVATAAEAAPIVDAGLASMRTAIDALENGDPGAALPAEIDAVEAVAQAIELFADVKNLIELAYATQGGIVALLTPGEDAEAVAMEPGERESLVGKSIADNQRRIDRLAALLEAEGGEAVAAVAEGDDAARQAVEARYALAEDLRVQVGDSLHRLAESTGGGAVEAARRSADEGLAGLEELRRLFFSIVEHLAALLADQGDTHDRAATLQVESSAALGDEFAPALGSVAQRQGGHAQMGDQIAAALARQADAASAPPEANAPAQDPEAGERLAKAAAEVRHAGGRMAGAATMLADAAERAKSMSPDLEGALEDQLAAMEPS